MKSSETRRSAALSWGWVALGTSITLMLLKLLVYAYTDSLAVLSDAMESVVNIGTSGFALFALWLSQQPRDAEHPYGHGKVEYLAELAEGAAIMTAGVAILVITATRSADGPDEIEGGWVGVGMTALIAFISLAMGTLIQCVGRRIGSVSLAADGEHIRADGVTTVGTFVALGLIRWTGWAWLDAVVACLIGVWLFYSGAKIVRASAGRVMDEANPALLEEIGELFEAAREPGWLAPHETRVQHLGGEIHVDMHMVFPRFWSLERAHDVATILEDVLEDRFGEGSELMLHMEPCTPVSCVYCDLEGCPVRSEEQRICPRWSGAYIAAHFRHGSSADPEARTWRRVAPPDAESEGPS